MSNLVKNKIDFTDAILEYCLEIARGECSITLDIVEKAKTERQGQILYGLYCMNEELVYSKEEDVQRVKSLYESQRLKDKNRELEQFAFKASHDLKEPIRTIFSFSQLLKNKIGDDADPKVNSYIDYIQVSAKRMTDMISHLLNYARFGNQSLFTKLDTHVLLQNVNFDLITQIQKVNGKLIIGELPQLTGDATLLRLLFQNIISNALKFKKEDVAPVVKVSSFENDTHHCFKIEDNGLGIKDQDLSNLFNIFARSEAIAKEIEGVGIGLAHCKKIVELHNGDIRCESKLGEGSTFFFTIFKNLECAAPPTTSE